ncbi:MAG: hypothetical protein LBS65_00520 [Desulfovibrio sp.]|nr:hypothetical protein [Desulfovibrio sp.]
MTKRKNHAPAFKAKVALAALSALSGSRERTEKHDGLAMMAEAILAVSRNPEEMRRMGRAGRELALRFSLRPSMDASETLLP